MAENRDFLLGAIAALEELLNGNYDPPPWMRMWIREKLDDYRAKLAALPETVEQPDTWALLERAEAALRDTVSLLDNRRRGFDQTVPIGDIRQQVVSEADEALAAISQARREAGR